MDTSRRGIIKLLAPLALIPAFISSAKGASTPASQPVKDNKVDTTARASFAANLLVDQKSIIIECYGDSTMWGSIPRNTTTMDPCNPSASLKSALELMFPGKVEVRNKAIPGTTLKLLLEGHDGGPGSYEERIMKSDALVIYCNHCLNDCNSYESDEVAYRENLIKFINVTRQYGKIPILVTPTIISPTDDGKEFMMKRMPAFIRTMKDIASLMSVDLVDNHYYSYKNSRVTNTSITAGDGVHLSSEGYQLAGRNMAIPLLNANVIANCLDLSGLSTSYYRDNISRSRVIWKTSSRFGSTLSGDATDKIQYIYYPIVLDNPTDNTILAVGGIQGEVGGLARATYFGESNSERFSGRLDFSRRYGLEYDGLLVPEKCKLPAGLNIIGIETSNAAGGKNFNFSGVQLLSRKGFVASSVKETKYGRAIIAGDNIELSFLLSKDEDLTLMTLHDSLDQLAVISLTSSSGALMFNVMNHSQEVFKTDSLTMPKIEIRFDSNRGVKLFCNGKEKADVKLSAALPVMYAKSTSRILVSQ